MTAPVKFWRYYLPSEKGEGWAVVFMDELGVFTAVTDWGNVGYRWSSWGQPDVSFRDWITARRDDAYLIAKFTQGRRVYDPEGTLKRVKKAIIDDRQCERLDAEGARAEWDLLFDHEDLETYMDLVRWHEVTKLDARDECYLEKPHPDATGFVKHVMPRLREVIRAELLAEQQVPA